MFLVVVFSEYKSDYIPTFCFRGKIPAVAEFHFLDHAKKIDMYGVDLHNAMVNTTKFNLVHLGNISKKHNLDFFELLLGKYLIK